MCAGKEIERSIMEEEARKASYIFYNDSKIVSNTSPVTKNQTVSTNE